MPRLLVVFDMDGVLIHERSSWGMVHESLGTSNEASHEAYLTDRIDDMEFMRRDIALWRSARPDITIYDINKVLSKATPMEGLDECVHGLRTAGAALSILSGGLKLLSERIAKDWGFDSNFANGLQAGPDGRLTGEGILEVPLKDKGGVLAERILKGNGFGPVVTVGDSTVDISMFKHSDLPIAFRAYDERVRRRAKRTVDVPDLLRVRDVILEWLEDGGNMPLSAPPQ